MKSAKPFEDSDINEYGTESNVLDESNLLAVSYTDYLYNEIIKMEKTNELSTFNYKSNCTTDCPICKKKYEFIDFVAYSISYKNGNEFGLEIRMCTTCGYIDFFNTRD